MNELSMKSDKKLPNLKLPAKGKKGVSKFMRKKAIGQMKDAVQSADRKPERYMKPDGKVGIRMVKTDKEVIKKESIDNHPKVKAARKAHAAGTWDGNVDKEGEAVVHINGKPHTVTNKSKTKNLRKEMVDPMDLRGRPRKRDPYPKSPYGMKHPLHPLNIQKSKEKELKKQQKKKKDEGMSFDQMMRMHHQASASQKKNQKKRDDKEKKSYGAKADMDMKARGTIKKEEQNGLMREAKYNYFDTKDDAHAHAKKHGGKVYTNTGKGATKVKGKPVNTHVVIKDAVDEALTMAQRMKKKRDMRRNKARIAIGRKRAKKKMANMKVIKKRSDRQARNAIAQKLTRGIPKRELTPSRKREIEKRLESPALKRRIQVLSKRMFKDVRKKEVMRKKS